MTHRSWVAALLIAATGCGSKKDEGGGKNEKGGGGGEKAKPKVALELTGAVTASLTGEDGECRAGGGGIEEARSFSIHSGQLGAPADFHLSLNALTDGPPTEGAAFVRLGKAQFLRDLAAATTSVTAANLFTVDGTLEEEGGERTIVVKGTVQCP